MIGKINEIIGPNVSNLFYFSPLLQPLPRILAFCSTFVVAFCAVGQSSFDFDSLSALDDSYNNKIVALQQLDSSLLVEELNQTQNDSLKVKLLNALCWKNYSSNPSISLVLAKQQLELVDRIGYEEARIPANDNLAHLHKRLGNYEAASEFLLRSLENYRIKKDTAGMIVSGFGVGNVLFELKQFVQARDYWMESYLLSKAKTDTTKMGQMLVNLGLVCTKLDLTDQSEIHYLEFNRLAALKPDDSYFRSALAATQGDLALLYMKQGKIQDAKLYFRRALATSQDRKHNITDLLGLSNCMKLQDLPDSMFYFVKQAEMVLSDNFSPQEAIDVYSSLAEAHAHVGHSDSAYRYMQQAFELRDTLITSDGLEAIAEMRTKFETERVENEAKISVLEADARAAEQKLYTWFSLLGIGVLIIIALLLVRGNRIKQRANRQLQEANAFIESQRDQIQQINTNLTDSIEYAKQIQDAILPSDERIHQGLKDAFVLFKPRDRVSGDFYWYHEVGDQVFAAAADCTGHGVPGAFVSMVCQGLLNKIVIEDQVLEPGEILRRAHAGVLSSFKNKQSVGQANDGMDIALTVWDKANKKLHFAGAMNPCFVVRGEQLIELEANRRGIGGVAEENYPFSSQSIDLENGDMVYLFSDGYKDQFGGPKGKKFMISRFKKLLISVSEKEAAEQYALLENEFYEWRGDSEQIDDVLLMGYRIN